MRRGAQLSPAWEAVETLESRRNSTNRKVKCLYCGCTRTLGASGVLAHLKSAGCRRGARPHPPPPGKASHAEMIKILEEYQGRSTRKRPGTASAGSVTKQARLSFRRMLSAQAADELVLRALVSTASPLSLLDNAHFTGMIEELTRGGHPHHELARRPGTGLLHASAPVARY